MQPQERTLILGFPQILVCLGQTLPSVTNWYHFMYLHLIPKAVYLHMPIPTHLLPSLQCASLVGVCATTGEHTYSQGHVDVREPIVCPCPYYLL